MSEAEKWQKMYWKVRQVSSDSGTLEVTEYFKQANDANALLEKSIQDQRLELFTMRKEKKVSLDPICLRFTSVPNIYS